MAADAELEDLQAVSRHILVTTEQIRALEEKKRGVDPASPQFEELSDEIERLANEMASVSHAETGLARELEGVEGLPSIAEVDAKGSA
jgi:malonyl CoA-acyl carrier protein transacylase